MAAPLHPLRAVGLRRTPHRVAVYQLLQAQARPLSHAELAEHDSLRGCDAITLYRTLRALVDHGLAHRILGADGIWRTCGHSLTREGCPGNHVHFHCTVCWRMVCLREQWMPVVEPPAGASVTHRSFLAQGVCADCHASPRAGEGATEGR